VGRGSTVQEDKTAGPAGSPGGFGDKPPFAFMGKLEKLTVGLK
jgi:hypothetical protein